jgi:uncharacterized protein (TIGR02246 family)
MTGFALLLAVLLGGESGYASTATPLPPQPEPSAVITAFVAAMVNADADALAAIFDDDATVFMPFDSVPQRLEGRDEIRKVFGRFFEQVRKSAAAPPYMKLEPRDVKTQLFGDTAIITFHLGRVPDATATSPSGFSRRTFVAHRKGDRWLVKHLHASNMQLQPPKRE